MNYITDTDQVHPARLYHQKILEDYKGNTGEAE